MVKIQDDGIPVLDRPNCGILLRDRPGELYRPACGHTEGLRDEAIPTVIVDEEIPGIHGG